MHSEIIIFLVNFQQQLRGLHFQTKSYARHKAYGETYKSLDDLIDEFTEVAMGKYGRVQFNKANIVIHDIEAPELDNLLGHVINELNSFTLKLDETDTDLLNIRDEILGVVNKLKYLLTLS
jgi:hypothetical protein